MKLALRPVKGRGAHCRGPLCPAYMPTVIPVGELALEMTFRASGGVVRTLHCQKCAAVIVDTMKGFVTSYTDLHKTPPSDVSKVELIFGEEDED
jgi:hypothetical protein